MRDYFMKEKKNKPQTYRESIQENSVKKFLGGEARQPYVLREDIVCGLKNRVMHTNGKNKKNDSSCICQETLGQFSDM